MGVSKGGTAGLCAAAGDKRIRAVVADGALPTDAMIRHLIRRYASCYASYYRISRLLPYVPDICLKSFCQWCRFLAGRRRKCRFLPVDAMARRVRQAVFLIHGERDQYVPLEVAHQLRRQLAGRCKLWLVRSANHNQAIHMARAQYEQRLVRFFLHHLACRPVAVMRRDRRLRRVAQTAG
jgi:pimeloyl-ACP methyl ester carboxylesterase